MKPLTMTPGREAFWRTLADAPDATLSPIAEFEAGIAREFLPVIDALRAERDEALAMVARLVDDFDTWAVAVESVIGRTMDQDKNWPALAAARALLAKQKEG